MGSRPPHIRMHSTFKSPEKSRWNTRRPFADVENWPAVKSRGFHCDCRGKTLVVCRKGGGGGGGERRKNQTIVFKREFDRVRDQQFSFQCFFLPPYLQPTEKPFECITSLQDGVKRVQEIVLKTFQTRKLIGKENKKIQPSVKQNKYCYQSFEEFLSFFYCDSVVDNL